MVLGLPLAAWAQNQHADEFIISGMVKGMKEKTKAFLTDANNPTDTLARATVKEGAFQLKGIINEPNMYELSFSNHPEKIPIFMGHDKVKVEGTMGDLKNLSVTGSPTNDDFLEFQKTFNPYFMRLNGLSQLAKSPAGAGKGDSISKVYMNTVSTVQTELDKFIQAKKSSYVSPFILVAVNQLSEDVFVLAKSAQLEQKRSTSPRPIQLANP